MVLGIASSWLLNPVPTPPAPASATEAKPVLTVQTKPSPETTIPEADKKSSATTKTTPPSAKNNPPPTALSTVSAFVPDNTGWTAIDLRTAKVEGKGTFERLPDGAVALHDGFIWSDVTFSGDIAVRAVFRSQAGGQNQRLYLRAKEAGNGYALNTLGGRKPAGDINSFVGSGYAPKTLSHYEHPLLNQRTTVEFRAVGNQLSALIQGKEVAKATDATHKTGKIGLFADEGILESLHYRVLDAPIAASKALELKPAKEPDAARWLPLWAADEQKTAIAPDWEWKEGRFTGKSAATRSTTKSTDAAVRAIALVGPGSDSPALIVRGGADDTVIASIERSAKVIRITQKNGKPGSAHEKLADIPVPSLTDGEHRLEATVVGSILGVTLDGSYIGGVQLPYPPAAGAIGVFARQGSATLREIEWQSLDPDATKPIPQLAKLPDPSKWRPVFPAAYLKNGAITFKPVNNLAPADVRFTDGAVRVKIPVSELGKGLNMRLRSSGGASVQVEFGTSGGTLRRIWREADQERSERLVGFGFRTPSETAEFAFVAVGQTLGFFVNNLQVAAASVPDTQSGQVSFYGKEATFNQPEWQSLDPAPEAAPKTAVELQLETLAAEYQAEFDKLGGLAFKAALSTLNTQFTAAIDRAAAQAQQKAQLDDVLTLQAEAKRMREAPSMPELDDDSTPAVLKPLHDTYRKSLAKLAADRDARTKPAREAYQKKLTAYQAERTKAGDIPGAVLVKDTLARVAKGEAAIPGAIASPRPGTQTKAGRLHAWGEQKSQPIDISAAAKYDDFIQVLGKEGYWYALRANGSLVTNLPFGFTGETPDLKHKVTKLRMCGPHIIAFGEKQITLKSNHLGYETVEAADWGGGPLRDAVIATGGVWLALREDGTLRMRDMKKQKGRPAIQPNQAAKLTRDLAGVAEIAVTRTCLLAVTQDGKAHAWNTPNRQFRDAEAVGEVVPVDCSPLPTNIKRVWGNSGSGPESGTFYILTEDGTLRRFDLALAAGKWEEMPNGLPPPGSVAEISVNAHILIATLKSGEKILVNSSSAEVAATVKEHSKAIDIFAHVLTHDDPKLGRVKSNFVLWIE